jgi:hypothetical protein
MKADDVKILSYVPGRVRLRVRPLKGNRNLVEVAQKEILAVPGVKEVTINELTGSVLLRYDNTMLGNQESVDAMLETLGLLFPSLDIDRIRVWLADKEKKERIHVWLKRKHES